MLTSGILIDATTSIGINTSYRFVDPADDVIARFSAYYDAIGGSTGGALQVEESDDSHDTLLEIESSCPSGQESVLELTAINAGDTDVEIKLTNGSAISTVEITNAGVTIGPSAGTVKDNALRVETNIIANSDLLAGGGIYAGDTSGTPGAGVIYAEDYGVFLGGIHVGGASDPGDDNLEVDGTAEISGYMAIGTSPGTYPLHLSTNLANFAAYIQNDGNDPNRYGLGIQAGQDANPVTRFVGFFDGDGDRVGNIDGDGAGGVNYNSLSDRRLKDITGHFDDSILDVIDNIEPFTYRAKGQTYGAPESAGFAAQDFSDIPGIASQDEEGFWSMDYARLTPILWAGERALLDKIEKLEQRIVELEAA
jgi:hypothetical protein